MKGDYDDVISRFRTDEKVKKSLAKVVSDPSFNQLTAAISEGKAEDALKNVQSLKALCKTLSLSGLVYSLSGLEDALRGKTAISEEVEPLFKKVKKDYALTMACIQMM